MYDMFLLKLIVMTSLVYVLTVSFYCISEIAYKKKKIMEVFLNLKQIMFNSLLLVLVLIVSTVIYYVILGKN